MKKLRILSRLRKSKATKITALVLVAEMLVQTINPPALLALTSGPTQPEVEGFQPIGVSDMVDPFTGDFSYNVPLLSVGDYPLNLAYQSGVTMDEEASWAGLGWNVHTGAITRQLRGIPDDFWGDEIIRNVHMRDNLTVGAKVMLGFETFGLDPETFGLNLGVGFDVNYNTYKGFGLSSLLNASISSQSASNGMNLGLSLASGPEGLNVAPNISFSSKIGKDANNAAGSANIGFGFNMNSRTGLSGMTLDGGVSISPKNANRKNVKTRSRTKEGKVVHGTKDKALSLNVASSSSSISFGQPTYTPQIDLPMLNLSGSGRFKIGGAVWANDIDVSVTGYGAIQTLAKNRLVNPSYGYVYSEKGNGNLDALHDFNREKDGTFTKEKKNLPLTNYTYDIFSISAQGVGGNFRAYRNDAGYVYDKRASSPSVSVDFGLELNPGNLIDFGFDFNANILESESKAWINGNGPANTLKFSSNQRDVITENVHFKLTGEKNVDSDPSFYTKLRDGKPVHFDLDRSKNFETPAYNNFVEMNGSKHNISQTKRNNRQYRNTAVYHHTVNDIIRAYPWKAKRISLHAKGHHIAEIAIIQPDGKRYIFGLAAYNTTQREMSFNVGAGGATPPLPASTQSGLVSNANQSAIAPGSAKRGIDHFYDETVTPAYAHTWMLTEILSADYVDVTGDGPTPDDLGTYTKFNYGNTPTVRDFKWRTPTVGGASASYMEGLKTDLTDDKGSIIYGEKDVWYVQSIESKTQIAIFHTSQREDALGANIDGVLQSAPAQRLRKLDAIKLYSRQEYLQNQHSPVPIKSVHFEYDYSLCPNTPNSLGRNQSKLTLREVYFTYKNSEAGRYSPYKFKYRETSQTTNQVFSYQYGRTDRWGIPRPNSAIPGGLTHSEWPYVTQNKASRDDYSSAWHLDNINLPSGGEINVKYESDDYGFVQDRAAMRMFRIEGLATDPSSSPSDVIVPFPLAPYRDYLILNLQDPSVTNSQQFREKYLVGYGKGNLSNNAVKHLYYRFQINVNGLYNPGNPLDPTPAPEYEYVSGYAEIDVNGSGYNPSTNKAYIKVKRVPAKMAGIWTNVSPFAYSAWQFSRLNTPRKAFNLPDPTDDAMEQIVKILSNADMARQIISFFQGPNGSMLSKGIGTRLKPSASWIRLMEPEKTKLGGGNRVKEITISNEWDVISTQEPKSVYGQEFSYIGDDGKTSGVAAYEPGIGADENPHRVPSFYSGPRQILIPDERFYMEEPFGESFFPGPSVGYSKVTVKDKVFDPDVTINTTGKTVHEFYTSFDFPTRCEHTTIDPQPREESAILQLFSPLKRKYMTATQGYTVTLNDMHGKEKSVSMYAQGESAPFSQTKYHYKLKNGKLDNMADVIDRDGKVYQRPIGLEIDFIADMREQSTTSSNISVNGNFATFIVPPMFPLGIPTIFPNFKMEKNRYRAATTTKVVQQFGIQDVTETYDKGAYVQTRITAYDARTGMPLVQELNNEFKDKYYKLEYPAHWAYTGMAQASQNIGYEFSYSGGALDGSRHIPLEPGDEVLPLGVALSRKKSGYVGTANTARYWVAKDDVSGEKFLIDHLGNKHVPPSTWSYKVIRSGHRNMQSTSLGSVTTTLSPVKNISGQNRIEIDASSKVIAASAVEYAERWKTDRGMLKYQGCDSSGANQWATGDVMMELLNYVLSEYGYLDKDSTLDWWESDDVLIPNEIGEKIKFRECSVSSFWFSRYQIHCDTVHDWELNKYPNLVNYINTGGISYAKLTPNIGCCDRTPDLFPLDDCSVFSPADWYRISHFNTVTYMGNDDFIITAILDDDNMVTFYMPFEPDGCVDVISESTQTCTPIYACEYADGDTINPYLYGILGNWRTKGDYFFMGDRDNTDASTAENLRTHGYLPGFKTYWKAPASTTDVWVRNTPLVSLGDYENWNWKTEMTLYSPYGFDIENINALPSYSSAQYGYLNTLPTAVANNAKQKEIGFDGFEDYYPWIAKPACTKSHFGFEDYIANLTQQHAHTGLWSMEIPDGNNLSKTVSLSPPYGLPQPRKVPYVLTKNDILQGFSPDMDKKQKFVLGFWARTGTRAYTVFDYTGITPDVKLDGNSIVEAGSLKKSKLINDWQRHELYFEIPSTATPEDLTIEIANSSGQSIYVDDIRVHPFDANIKTFVYHMFDFNYMAQLDENNFATFYEYDSSGKLVRVKKETERGIVTLQENRNNMYKR